MAEYRYEELYQEVEKSFKRLNKFIQNLEGTNEKVASLTYILTNILIENLKRIEGLGILETIKHYLLNDGSTRGVPVENDVCYIA